MTQSDTETVAISDAGTPPSTDPSGNSKIRLARKGARFLRKHGPAIAARRVIWKYYYERFQKQIANRAAQTGKDALSLQFLGAAFDLHPTKRGLSEELAMFGTHEPLATSSYLEFVKPGDQVIDVGSNIGYWLLLAASKIGTSGRILGFEPVPAVFEILKRNIQHAGYSNVELYPWAIGSKAGNAEFYQSKIPNWGSLIQDNRLLPTGSYQVSVKKLDDILDDHPSLRPTILRMDVEGAELMVLEGARRIVSRFKPSLCVEFHPFILGWQMIRDLLTDFQALGYSSGILIERTWDHPWISAWMRERRRWSGSISKLIQRIESPQTNLVESTFTLILRGVGE